MQAPQKRPRRAGGEDAQARRQLIDGFCKAIEKNGYAATTIADVVRRARVSKRTFYEQFADKEDCFRAAYAVEADELLQTVVEAVRPGGTWREQVDAAISAYLEKLDERPALTRAFFLAIHAAGPPALRLRRQVMQRFAELAQSLVERGRRDGAGVTSLSPTMAMAIVGAINELVLLKVEARGTTPLADLAETAVELVGAVLAPRSRRRQRL